MRRPWLLVLLLILLLGGGVAALVSVDRAAPVNGPAPETAPPAAPPEAARPIVRSTFTITVMDDAKTRVAKATVHLHHGFDATTSIYRESASAETDDAGVARFSVPVAGDHVVFRAIRGSDVAWSGRIAPTTGADGEYALYVGPGVVVTGRVRKAPEGTTKSVAFDDDVEAEPLPGATVVMEIPRADDAGWRDRKPVRWGVAADIDGYVLLPAVRMADENGDLRLRAAAPGYAAHSLSVSGSDADLDELVKTVGSGANADRTAGPRFLTFDTLLLSRARTIRGRCVSVSGKPVEELLIDVAGCDLSTKSRPDGTFELDGVPDRPVAIVFHLPGNVMRSVPLPIGGNVDLGDVRAGLGSMISGVVLDGEGGPAAGVLVHALQAGELTTLAITDAQGRFALLDPPIGDVDLVAWTRPPESSPHLVPLVAQVPAVDGARDVEIRLPGVATLRLTVVDETTGKPVTGCSLTVRMQRADRPDERKALDYGETLRDLSVARKLDFPLDGAPVELHFDPNVAESAELVLRMDSKSCGSCDVDLRGCAPGKITERTVSVRFRPR